MERLRVAHQKQKGDLEVKYGRPASPSWWLFNFNRAFYWNFDPIAVVFTDSRRKDEQQAYLCVLLPLALADEQPSVLRAYPSRKLEQIMG
jgi:hypothetical protein